MHPDSSMTKLQESIWIIMFNNTCCLDTASFSLQTHLCHIPGTGAVAHYTRHALNVACGLVHRTNVLLTLLSHLSNSKSPSNLSSHTAFPRKHSRMIIPLCICLWAFHVAQLVTDLLISFTYINL